MLLSHVLTSYAYSPDNCRSKFTRQLWRCSWPRCWCCSAPLWSSYRRRTQPRSLHSQSTSKRSDITVATQTRCMHTQSIYVHKILSKRETQDSKKILEYQGALDTVVMDEKQVIKSHTFNFLSRKQIFLNRVINLLYWSLNWESFMPFRASEVT